LAFLNYDSKNPDDLKQTFLADIKWPVYQVAAKALEINKINLVEHDKTAMSPVDFCLRLQEKLMSLYPDINVDEKGSPRICIGGHNTHFDRRQLDFLINYALDECKPEFKHPIKNLRKMFSHRMIDTYPIASFLVDVGALKATYGYGNSLDLPAITNALGISLEGTDAHHTALGDVTATAMAYTAMFRMIANELSKVSVG
jgi:hypothetical protein